MASALQRVSHLLLHTGSSSSSAALESVAEDDASATPVSIHAMDKDADKQTLVMAASPHQSENPEIPTTSSHRPSQIRTCPIPEKLRLKMLDTSGDSAGSSSPTVVSPTHWTADAMRSNVLDGPRVRRRGTVSTISSSVSSTRRASRFSVSASDKQGMSPGAADQIPLERGIVTATPIAQRTSSHNTDLSTASATPTSVNKDAASVLSNASDDQPALLAGWDATATTARLPSRSRNRSRRYS
ncbi:hypothetical protein EC988_009069, partial [Linderina pennispora]